MKTNDSIKILAIMAGVGFSTFSPIPAGSDTDAESATSSKSSAGDSVPEELTPTEWAGIREAHEAWKHRFAEDDDGTFSAANPSQQWRTVFDGRGFTAEPHNHAWRWGLELTGYGIGKSRRPVIGNARTEATEKRLSYRWGEDLEEWFLNDGRGLEQGWTLSKRPSGAVDEMLRLDLAVRGDLRPVVDGEGHSVNFVSEDGVTALTYGGLKALDAAGRPLPARFLSRGEGIAVTVDERGATYPVTIDPIAQQAYLKASNTGGDDEFGWSVAVSGDTAVVGARLEDSTTMGVNNGGEDNNDAVDSGAAYVFTRSGITWSQQAYLKASNTGGGDQFGESVAVSGDTVVVGALAEASNTMGVNTSDGSNNSAADSGAAYVFTRSAGIWSEQAYLKASNTGASDRFGTSVAVSGDTVVVGADGEDSSSTGVNSVPDEAMASAGAAYVFTRSEVTWSQQAYLKASNSGVFDSFGISVAVSGDTVVAGAYLEASSTTGVNNGGESNNDADGSGAAYVFTRDGMGDWSQQAYLKASSTFEFVWFGTSVAVSGDTVVVGAPGEDAVAAYVFTRIGVTWSQQALLRGSNTGGGDGFGISVAVSGDNVIVGAYEEDSGTMGVNTAPDELAGDSGAAYVFTRSGATWSQQAYLKASNTEAFDFFGVSVAVSGDTVVVGAYEEASSTTGVNSGPNELADDAGAAYVFTITPSPPTPAPPPPAADPNAAAKSALANKIKKLKKKLRKAKNKRGLRKKIKKFQKKLRALG